MMDRSVRRARQSCLASNAAWRREAQHLRALSVRSAHFEDSVMRLRREAEAADRQADWWLNAAVETR
jgi:hypothetical protein